MSNEREKQVNGFVLTVCVIFPPQTVKVGFRFSNKNVCENSTTGRSLTLAASHSNLGAFLGKQSNVTRRHHMLHTILVNMICVKVT